MPGEVEALRALLAQVVTRAEWIKELRNNARRMRSTLKHNGDLRAASKALAECVEAYALWESEQADG